MILSASAGILLLQPAFGQCYRNVARQAGQADP